MKQRKQQCFVQLNITFQYTQKANFIYIVLVVPKTLLGKLIATQLGNQMKIIPVKNNFCISTFQKVNTFHILFDLISLPDFDASTTEINKKQHFVNAIKSNFCVLGTCCNWFKFYFQKYCNSKNLQLKHDVSESSLALVIS